MRTKSMVLIVIAAVCGLVASIGISQMLDSNNSAPQIEMSKVFVANHVLDLNTKLNESHVRLEEWPKAKIPEGAITNFEEIKDRFVISPFMKGDVIFHSKISQEQFGATTTIPDGYRSVAIRVSVSDSTALMKPGDRVDVLLFVRKGPDVPATMTRTILTNVRIFAVGGEITRTIDKDGKAMQAQTVNVLVLPDQVQKLMLASELGTIKLSLRSANETALDTKPQDTVARDIFDSHDSNATPDENVQNKAETKPVITPPNPGNLAGFLKTITTQPSTTQLVPATNEDKPWVMEIHTPDGTKYLKWNSPLEPPQEISRDFVLRSGGGFGAAPAQTVNTRSLIGQSVDLTGTLLQGGTFDLRSLQGSPVVVAVWATWCPACVKEFPLVKSLNDQYAARGLKVVSVNLDQEPSVAGTYVTKQNFTGPVLIGPENNDWTKKMGIESIPTLLLIDANGRLAGVANQVGAIVSQIELLLATPPKPADSQQPSEPVIVPLDENKTSAAKNENAGFITKSADEKKTGTAVGKGALVAPSSPITQRLQRTLK